jgi:hypothetical protein
LVRARVCRPPSVRRRIDGSNTMTEFGQ